MKRLIFLFFILIGLSGCVSIEHNQTLNKSFPAAGEYTILGEASCVKSGFILLGIIWVGEGTYIDLLGAARTKYHQVDDVVSVSVDRTVRGPYILFARYETILRGIAIRYTDSPPAK